MKNFSLLCTAAEFKVNKNNGLTKYTKTKLTFCIYKSLVLHTLLLLHRRE